MEFVAPGRESLVAGQSFLRRINLREDVPDEITDLVFFPDRHFPAPPCLENDAVHLHFKVRPSGAKHGELLGLHEEFDALAGSGVLRAASAGNAFGQPGGKPGLMCLANRIGSPVVRRRVAVGVENLGLEIADERLDFGA